jgi:hypothetical protein
VKIDKISKKLGCYILEIDKNFILYNSNFNFIVSNGIRIYLDNDDLKNFLLKKLLLYASYKNDELADEVKMLIETKVENQSNDQFNEVILRSSITQTIIRRSNDNDWTFPYHCFELFLNHKYDAYISMRFYANSDDFMAEYLRDPRVRNNSPISTITSIYKIMHINKTPKYTTGGKFHRYEVFINDVENPMDNSIHSFTAFSSYGEKKPVE